MCWTTEMQYSKKNNNSSMFSIKIILDFCFLGSRIETLEVEFIC